jgi:hypothetical protein
MSEKSIQDESQEWWDYPKCLEDYNPVVVDGDAITRRMKELASDLFTDEDSVDVQIIERYGKRPFVWVCLGLPLNYYRREVARGLYWSW